MKYSLVATTGRDVDALEPLFRVSRSDAELIIVDSEYSKKKLSGLRKLEHSFKRVVYAPPKAPSVERKYDLVSGLNTAYAYAVGDIFIRVDDWMELAPDFFERLDETVSVFKSLFGENFVIRNYDVTVKWKGDFTDNPVRYHTVPARLLPHASSAGLFICHKSVVYDLNGLDERYDDGTGWNDNDLVWKVFAAGKYFFIVDVRLMAYRHPHVAVAPWDRIINKRLLMSLINSESVFGKYKCNDSFSLADLHKEFSGNRKRFLL